MADQDMDRHHKATPYKLQKARERGQVAKSREVVSAVTFLAAMLYLTSQGWTSWQRLFHINSAVLVQAGYLQATPAALWDMVATAVIAALSIGTGFLVTLVIAAVLGNVLQTGVVLSMEPIKPDWNRLNPAEGFKRLFSPRVLFDAIRTVLKLMLLLAVSWHALKALAPQLYRLASLPAGGFLRALLDGYASLGMRMGLLVAVLALVDLLYTRREFSKKMRMSHKELKDEIKNRDGDPRIRSRMRELRREMFKRSLSLQRTRDADVLITNPTHVAVALRYVHGEMMSPQLVAKGAGSVAAKMRAIASRHNIPVVQNRPLARALFEDMDINAQVPPSHYAQVARIIVWVFAMRRARERREGAGE